MLIFLFRSDMDFFVDKRVRFIAATVMKPKKALLQTASSQQGNLLQIILFQILLPQLQGNFLPRFRYSLHTSLVISHHYPHLF